MINFVMLLVKLLDCVDAIGVDGERLTEQSGRRNGRSTRVVLMILVIFVADGSLLLIMFDDINSICAGAGL